MTEGIGLEPLANGPAVENNMQPVDDNMEGNADIPFPAFGLHLFAGLDDDDLIQLIRDSSFLVPDNADIQEDIVSHLRQLDEP